MKGSQSRVFLFFAWWIVAPTEDKNNRTKSSVWSFLIPEVVLTFRGSPSAKVARRETRSLLYSLYSMACWMENCMCLYCSTEKLVKIWRDLGQVIMWLHVARSDKELLSEPCPCRWELSVRRCRIFAMRNPLGETMNNCSSRFANVSCFVERFALESSHG